MIRKTITKTKHFVYSHKIISGLILLVVLFVGYKLFSGDSSSQETFVVKNAQVVQKVIVNGKTKPVHSVDLGFEINGTVSGVFVGIGSRVGVGQSLVSLDSGQLNAQYLKSEANLASENAKLDEIKKGTRPEELAVSETTYLNAKTSLSEAQQNLKDKVSDIIGNNVDQLFVNQHTATPQFNLAITDSQLKNDIVLGRTQMEVILKSWDLETGKNNLSQVSAFVDNVARAVNSITSGPNLSQTTLDGYKSSISSAKTTLITYRDALSSAESALALAEKNFSLKKSGSTPEAVASQVAKVMQAEADLQNSQAQLSKTVLRSPQYGVVTKKDVEVGETVTPGKIVLSVISDSNLELESNVSEISIGKVKIGNKVDISFDAFPGEVFKGTVAYVEPAETIVDGVVNYKVTVSFNEKYPQVKSGLTSKLDIITSETGDVVTVPQYAVLEENGQSFVNKKDGGKFVKTQVTIGLRGGDGLVEVVSGLSLGDVIEIVKPAN